MARPRPSISMLFDVFVMHQRMRELTTLALTQTGMRPDEYAVYSVVFELGPISPSDMGRRLGMPLTTVLDYVREMTSRGHVARHKHPRDSRSYRLQLTPDGLSHFRRANRAWNVMLPHLEAALPYPREEIQEKIQVLTDAADRAIDSLLEQTAGKTG